MYILALDASTKSSGIAVFNDTKLVHYDCLTASSTDVIKRIYKITDALQKVLEQYDISTIIMEEVRPETSNSSTTNLHTQRILMWLQANINFMIHDNFPKVKVEYVYPSEWRKQCGIRQGRGVHRNAQKELDIKFVKDYYCIDVNDDIADAIGIGHAHVNKLDSMMS